MKELFIDDDKDIIIVGRPSFKYKEIHTEYNPLTDVKKIWVKKL